MAHDSLLQNGKFSKMQQLQPDDLLMVSANSTVKMQLSLKNWVLRVAGKQRVSTWIREAIIEKLEREK
jgi:hypothetical protein